MRTVAVAGLLALVGALATLVRVGPLPGDVELARALGSDVPVFVLVSRITSLTVWIPIVLVGSAALWIAGDRAAARLLAIATVSAEVVSLALKELIGRPRPGGVVAGDLVGADAFPSNSVLRVVVAVGVIAAIAYWRWPRWRAAGAIVVAVVAIVVGVARVAIGDHWPSDVLGSYLLATAWLVVATPFARSTAASPANASPALRHTERRDLTTPPPRPGEGDFLEGTRNPPS